MFCLDSINLKNLVFLYDVFILRSVLAANLVVSNLYLARIVAF